MTTKNELTEELIKGSYFDYTLEVEHLTLKNAHSFGMKAGYELGRKSTKNHNMDKFAEYLVESIFECGDDDRGAVARIELKIPNPDTGGEYSSGGFCRSALVNFVRTKLDELNEQTNQGGEE